MPKPPAKGARKDLSTRSANNGAAADGVSPDRSLGEPFSYKGLHYPLGRGGPEQGALIPLAPGVGWMRLPVPGSLRHINVWALDDRDAAGEGVALVDTGMNLPVAREAWDALFEGPLAGKRVTRVIVTHFHPDHIGLAGWLCERFGVALWMTRTEWLLARMLIADVRPVPPRDAFVEWRLAGWDEARIAKAAAQGWGRFAIVASMPPASFVRIADGDRIAIGERTWRIVVGSGHTPEHACLVDEAGGLMIAGDQVLPRITTNVSLTMNEPAGDPLGDWLASIDRVLTLPAGLLVLPAHGEPFTGLHTRLAALRDGHRGQLDALQAHLAEPRRAIDCFSILFARAIDDSVYPLATGEAMAHLRRLEREGRAKADIRDGVAWFRRA